MKLYLVKLQGFSEKYNSSYVVAEHPSQAYDKVKKFLDDNDIGFSKDRELDSITLIADTYQYGDINCLLYLPQ